MLITILYAIWIAYTVGSLSLLAFFLIITWYSKRKRQTQNKIISEMLKVRPYDDRDWHDM
jgi:hypothetical protein